jgi:manganese/zinc/iron transport system substrate-binding protein
LDDPADGLPVVATTTLIADAAREVGGRHVSVTALMPPGTDPHTYQPSAADAVALSSARLVLFNGLHLEGKMGDLLARSPTAAAVTRTIPPELLRPADGGDHDPHVWFDVSLWVRCVGVVRDALVTADPGNAADYRANADRYARTLADLHAEVKAAAETLPAGRRVLVTSHDAFGYFGRAYGFEVRGLQGVSTAAGVGTRDVDEVAGFLADRQVPAVFAESSVPDKGLKKVLDTAAARTGRPVTLVGGDDALFSDSLGPVGGPTGTYVGVVRHNLRVITRALGE